MTTSEQEMKIVQDQQNFEKWLARTSQDEYEEWLEHGGWQVMLDKQWHFKRKKL